MLGFSAENAGKRYQLFAKDFKINVYILGKELSPHAQNIKIGSTDLCFEISGGIEKYIKDLENRGLQIELGSMMLGWLFLYLMKPPKKAKSPCTLPMSRLQSISPQPERWLPEYSAAS